MILLIVKIVIHMYLVGATTYEVFHQAYPDTFLSNPRAEAINLFVMALVLSIFNVVDALKNKLQKWLAAKKTPISVQFTPKEEKD